MIKDVLKKAVEAAGGQTSLARKIGKTQGHISKWLQREYIPAEAVLPIESVTGIPRHELRPDLYPIGQTSFRPVDLEMTTQGAEGLPRRRWTVAEIEAAVVLGILSADERFEMIGGELIPMAAKGSRHEHYKVSLLDFWQQKSDRSSRIAQETTFRLDAATFLEPDFVFYDAKFKYTDLAPANTLLVVEVSDTSLAYDMGRKSRIYANYDIRTLWVIDVNLVEIHIFERPRSDGYAIKRLVGPSEMVAPDFAPSLGMKLGELPLI